MTTIGNRPNHEAGAEYRGADSPIAPEEHHPVAETITV
jgi:hypothetical protein